MQNIQQRLTDQNLIGLILARVAHGRWEASVETAPGKWRDGPPCDDADLALDAVLGAAMPALPPAPVCGGVPALPY